MNFFGRSIFSALVVTFLVVLISSCEEELDTPGDGLVNNNPFTTGEAEFDVFAYNKFIEAVQSNRLPIYQLGNFNDPIYGNTEATITTQLTLSALNPTFGDLPQNIELLTDMSGNGDTLAENETVTRVELYIPYLTTANTNSDADNDGVEDAFDDDSTTGDSNEDDDLLTDAEENALGTDPFDPLDPDSDGDGELSEEEAAAISANNFAERFDLDNLDPNANFQVAQEFFSNQQFSPDFVSDILADDVTVTIDDRQFIEFFEEDDEDTDVDETTLIETRMNPGIRVELDRQFFQENLIDKEGSSELLSAANFNDFIRGIHLSITPEADDLMMLLDLSQAMITVTYEYTNFTSQTVDGETTTGTEIVEEDFLLSLSSILGGNAVNTFNNDAYSAEIASSLDTDLNAERIFLKGGAGTFTEIKLFDEDDAAANAIINEIRQNNWLINEANLVFYVDRESLGQSQFNFEPNRLYLFNAETNEPLYETSTEFADFSSGTSLGLFQNYDGILEEEDGLGLKYTVRITEYINDIIIRDSTNARLGLTLSSNIGIVNVEEAIAPNEESINVPIMATTTPLGTVLYGSNVSDDELDVKLRLQIFFTEGN